MVRRQISALGLAFLLILAFVGNSRADGGVAAVKSCESDNDPPDDAARLTILPNGEFRDSDTAAALIRIARQKAREGKDTEAIQWAALCNFADQKHKKPSRRRAPWCFST